jgi:LemA protein
METGAMVWVAGGAPILLIITVAVIYNGFVVRRRDIERAWLALEKLLRHRHDELLPHLIYLAKERMGADVPILSDLMVARGRAMGAECITNRGKAESALTREVRRLFAFLKSYQDILENWEMLRVVASLREAEKEIGVSRRNYNTLVTKFNNRRDSFPYNLVALTLRVSEGEYFQTEETPQELIAVGQEFIQRRN